MINRLLKYENGTVREAKENIEKNFDINIETIQELKLEAKNKLEDLNPRTVVAISGFIISILVAISRFTGDQVVTGVIMFFVVIFFFSLVINLRWDSNSIKKINAINFAIAQIEQELLSKDTQETKDVSE